MPVNFSAVLLAGGQSSRMGRDKAGLAFQGVALWQRQLAVLQACGAEEIFISGKTTSPYGSYGVEIVEDDKPETGPVTGLVMSLRRMRAPLLLVLAVDMPNVSSSYLRKLVTLAQPGRGIVPQLGKNFEPLAAVYPREALKLASRCREQDTSLQEFVERGIKAELLAAHRVPSKEAGIFANINTPDDLRYISGM